LCGTINANSINGRQATRQAETAKVVSLAARNTAAFAVAA